MIIKKKITKKKKISNKIPKTRKPINVYAQNMKYMNEKYKYLLSELTNTLKINQWLKVSNEKYNPINHINNFDIKHKTKYQGFKPVGSYYSKGGWLFHEDVCCKLDNEIILIEVDYNTIYSITGDNPFNSPIEDKKYKDALDSFTNKYGKPFGKDKCKEDKTLVNKTKVKCNMIKKQSECKNNCYWESKYKIFDWGSLYKKYDGFAIYPYPEKELIKSSENNFAFNTYDVETLVLWNHKPVIKYYNLGKISDIIHDSDIKINIHKKYNNYSDYIDKFIPKLIQKIQNIKAIKTTPTSSS